MTKLGFLARNLIGAFWNWWLADLYYLREEAVKREKNSA